MAPSTGSRKQTSVENNLNKSFIHCYRLIPFRGFRKEKAWETCLEVRGWGWTICLSTPQWGREITPKAKMRSFKWCFCGSRVYGAGRKPRRAADFKRWGTNPVACLSLNPFSPLEEPLNLRAEHEASQDPCSTPRLPPAAVSTSHVPASSLTAPHSYLLHVSRRVSLDQIL